MVELDDQHLLFIEPIGPMSAEPVEDELTQKMRIALNEAVNRGSYLGVHQCACGAYSDNNDYELPGGLGTNSLAIHYLQYHRSEIPPSEIEKLKALKCRRNKPTFEFDNCPIGEPNPDVYDPPAGAIGPDMVERVVDGILGQAMVYDASQVRLHLEANEGVVTIVRKLQTAEEIMRPEGYALSAAMSRIKVLASKFRQFENGNFKKGKIELVMHEQSRGFTVRYDFWVQSQLSGADEIITLTVHKSMHARKSVPALDLDMP